MPATLVTCAACGGDLTAAGTPAGCLCAARPRTPWPDAADGVIDYQAAIGLARIVPRVAIIGGPGAGKTTLALAIDRPEPALHTDAVVGEPWEAQRPIVAGWVVDKAAWLVEGIVAVRCLRRRDIAPDLVLWMPGCHRDLTPGGERLAASVRSWICDYLAQTGRAVVLEVLPRPSEAG